MTLSKFGILLLAFGISIQFILGLDPDLYFKIKQTEYIDRDNFDFFPFPVVHDDGITVEFVTGEGLNLDEDGWILLTSLQAANFEKLDTAKTKLLHDSEWHEISFKIGKYDEKVKKIDIYLSSLWGFKRHYTSYLFADGKLKLETAIVQDKIRRKMYIPDCMTFLVIIAGFAMITIARVKSILRQKKSAKESPSNVT